MDSTEVEFQGVEDNELLYFIADREKDEATARRAWAELCARRKEGLARTCLRFVSQRLEYSSATLQLALPAADEIANDLANEVLIAVWRRLAASFTEDPAPGTASKVVAYWLASIARNLWVNQLKSGIRKERRAVRNTAKSVDEDTPEEPVQWLDDGTFEAPDKSLGAEELIHRTQLLEIVRAVLDQLPPRHRKVLQVAIECDVAFGSGGRGDADAAREMASRLNMPIGSARQAKNRAMKAFRELVAASHQSRRTHEEPGQDAGTARPANGR